jgi:glycosyltransferase involved in cell wall biosynthesis
MVAPELHPWKLDGVSEVVRGLSNALAEIEGLELTVLATTPPGADPYAASYSRRIKFLLVNKPNSPEPFYHLSLQVAYLRHFLAWGRKNTKGVVHFEILPGARAGMAAAACILWGRPRIVTFHGWPPAEIGFEQSLPRKLGHWGHWAIARLFLPFFSCFVVNSRHMREFVARRWRGKKIYVIPNGLNLKLWSMNKEAPSESRPSVAYWGKLNTRKGAWLLLKGFESFCRLSGSEHPPLFLIGNGEEIETMQSWVKEKGLSDWVKFLGEHPPERIRDIVKSVPIAVSSSPYEPFGIAALEAMAAGKAVIVPDRGGPIDFVTDERNGLCVNVQDPQSFAAALSRLLIDSSLRERLAEEAKKTARNFDWPLIAPRYVALYNQIAGSGGAS